MRIRSIKPEFFTSLTIADLPLTARLTFIGLWTHVDDEGRCVDDARLIKAAVWPLDDRNAADVEADLAALTERSLIIRYAVRGRRYLIVRAWREHQKINRPTASKLPPPARTAPEPEPEPPTSHDCASSTAQPRLTENSPQEGNREQGAGNKEGRREPARSCTPAPGTPHASRGQPDGRTPIDDADFHITDGMRRWAHQTFPHVDVEYETAQFLDHFRAEGTRRRNWSAEWQKWIRRANKWASEHSRRPAHLAGAAGAENVVPLRSTLPLTGTDARVADWLALPTEGGS